MSRDRLSRKQILDIGTFLKDVLTKVGDDCATYNGDWDDQKVAVHFGVPINSVGLLRRQAFGNFPKASNAAVDKPSEGKVKALALRLEAVEKRLSHLEEELGVKCNG